MATIEAPKPGVLIEDEEKFEEPPEMVAHLYWSGGVPVSHCGIHARNDPHNRWHLSQGQCGEFVLKGETVCPTCGAPLCPICQAIGYAK